MTESELSKKRLAWQCRRGMLELDVLLTRFLDHSYEKLSLADKRCFVDLLTSIDPELYAWLMGQEAPPAKFARLIDAIKQS